MTACFSLRLRLKVYSLIMCFSGGAFALSGQHAYVQRPTVSDSFQNHSAAGPPSALAVLRRLSGGLAPAAPTVLDGLPKPKLRQPTTSTRPFGRIKFRDYAAMVCV